jgi:glycosyltransferase involved in cell wall biosynthesis
MKDKYYLYWLNAKQSSIIKNFEKSRSWRYTKYARLIFRLIRLLRKKIKNKEGYSYPQESSRNLMNYSNSGPLKLDEIKLIIFSHELSRTGAPFVALDFIKNCGLTTAEILVVGPREDSLAIEFCQHSQLYLYNDDLNQLSIFIADNKKIFQKARVILNTLTLFDIAQILYSNDVKFLTWGHELQSSWNIIGINRVSWQLLNSELTIVDSLTLKEQVTEYFKNDVNCIFIENGFYGRIVHSSQAIREKLSIADDEILLIIPGTRQIRKGFDLLPKLAELIFGSGDRNNIRIIWIGDSNDVELDVYIKSELSGYIDSKLILIFNNSPHYLDLLNASDGIVSLSREDSAPQVLAAAKELGLHIFKLDPLISSSRKNLTWRTVAMEKLSVDINIYKNNFVKKKSNHIHEINTWPKFVKNYESALKSTHLGLATQDALLTNSEIKFNKTVIPVTIVIVFYNQESFVIDRLNSIVNQTVIANEIFIIDDASSDSTLEKVISFTDQWKSVNFKVIKNTYNKGISTKNWLEGVTFSKNEYVWIVEGDDFSDPNFLEITYQIMKTKNVDIVVTGNHLIDDSTNVPINVRDISNDGSLSLFPLLFARSITEPELDFEEIRNLALNMGNPFYNIGQFLWKKGNILEALKKSEHNLTLFCDYEVYLNIPGTSKFYFLEQNLNYFRTHQKSIRAQTSLDDYMQQSLSLFTSKFLRNPQISISNKLQYLINCLRLVPPDDDIFKTLTEMIRSIGANLYEDRVLFLNHHSGQKYFYKETVNSLIQIVSRHFEVLSLTLPSCLSQTQINLIIDLLRPTFILIDATQSNIDVGMQSTPTLKILDLHAISTNEGALENIDLLVFIGNPEDIFLAGWPISKIFFIAKKLQFEDLNYLSMHLLQYMKGVIKSHQKS